LSISCKDGLHRECGPLEFTFPDLFIKCLTARGLERREELSGCQPNGSSLYPLLFNMGESFVLTVDAVVCDVKIGMLNFR
jgi:hypothetical protein